jgi:hypothetical protein
VGTVHAIGPNTPSIENVITVLEMAKSEALKVGATRCIVILLKQDGMDYKHKYLNAGMVTSEMVSLLEIQKCDIIKGMGNG